MRSLFILSVALNIGLLFVIGFSVKSGTSLGLESTGFETPHVNTAKVLQGPSVADRAEIFNDSRIVEEFSRILHRQDINYDELKQILLRGGFSPGFSRAILNSLVFEKYDKEMADAIEQDIKDAYWSQKSVWEGEKASLVLAKIRSEQETISDLYLDAVSEVDKAKRKVKYGSIPYAKAVELDYINKKFLETEISMFKKLEDNDAAAIERVKLVREVERAKEKEIADLLTPDEFREWELRNSSSALKVQQEVAQFELNPNQYEKLVDLTRDFDSVYGYLTGDPILDMQAVNEGASVFAKKAIVIGGLQGAEYLRQRSPQFVQVEKIAIDRGGGVDEAILAWSAISDSISQFARAGDEATVDSFERTLFSNLHDRVGDLATDISANHDFWTQLLSQAESIVHTKSKE